MNLLLWRHAEAEDGSPDLARKLTRKGEQQARAVGKWLGSHFPSKGRILVSPAQRTRQTADTLEREYEIENTIAPGAAIASVLTAAGLTDRLRPVGEAIDSHLLLVGHQPWVGVTARLLLAGQNRDWSVRKAAVWWLVYRPHYGDGEWTLRAVIDPDCV